MPFARSRSALAVTALALFAACSDEVPPPATSAPVPASPSTPRAERLVPALAAELARYDGLARPEVNVLLISLDSTRRDFLSCYGYRPPHAPDAKTSPHIDRIAAEGVIMADYRANSSWTLPTHMSMLVGQPTLVHGIDDGPFALAWHRPTLAHVLQRLGYRTAGFYTGPFVHERFGFDRGFDRYEDAYGPTAAAENQRRAQVQEQIDQAVRDGEVQLADRLALQIEQLDEKLDKLSHRDRSSQIVTDKAIAAIDAAAAEQRPWFVLAHYFDPHYDYDPPAPWDTKFDPDYTGDVDGKAFFMNTKVRKARLPKEVPTFETGIFPGAPPRTTERAISDRDLEHIEALYAGEIGWTDSQLGRLFDHLRANGTLDHTLVIVTADHGEEFFEHGGIGHRHNLLEEQMIVPMIMRLPGKLPAGARVRGLASHTDVMATVLDLLAVPLPNGITSRSMVPLIDGSEDGTDRHALGRLVFTFRGKRGPPIKRVTIRDVFYRGDLKLLRIRHYREPVLGECPSDRAQQIRENAFESRSTDLWLQWIDLSRHPEERPEQFSSDFGDPRAAAALAAFQQRYHELQAEPDDCWIAFGGEAAWLIRDRPEFQSSVRNRREQYVIGPPGQ